MAVSGWYSHSPDELLSAIHEIEAGYGRDRSNEIIKGPRTLDIDILLFSDKIIAEPHLIIPHPGLIERKFALLPLLELDYNLVHPALGVPLWKIAAALPTQGIYPVDDYQYDGPYPE